MRGVLREPRIEVGAELVMILPDLCGANGKTVSFNFDELVCFLSLCLF